MFSPGDLIKRRGGAAQKGVIQLVGPEHGGIQYYKVFWEGGSSGNVAEGDLYADATFEHPHEELIEGRLGNYHGFLRMMTLHRLYRDVPLRNNIIAFNASRTRFYPYQFKPLIKFLDSPNRRMLVADEVGLGKTIEAGLVLTELEARQDVRRVLVVCPANLREKWEMELRRRFEQRFEILQSGRMLQFLERYEESSGQEGLKGIISLETIRTDLLRERLEALSPQFDLVIVDEAHHVRNPNQQQRAVAILSQNADAMLMLTATPVQLGSHNLYALLSVLDEEVFPDFETAQQRFAENEPIVTAQDLVGRIDFDEMAVREKLERAGRSGEVQRNHNYQASLDLLGEIREAPADNADRRRVLVTRLQRHLADLNLIGHIFTRTRKRDVHAYVAQREAVAVRMELGEDERRFYNTVTQFVRARSREQTGNPVVRQWILNTPQRQMASSIGAMVEHYRRALDSDPEAGMEDPGLSTGNGGKGKGDAAKKTEALRKQLREIVRNWPRHDTDTKFSSLVGKVLTPLAEGARETGEPVKVLLFAFFKPTLRYLQQRLREEGYTALLISGDVPPDERVQIIERFRTDPAVSVLLSSRVGSEGLDFQFCHHMVNYDLPWNPMEVEQRIGRLDRIGQESPRIFIYNFYVADTIEERILRILYERIRIFERSVGGLEMILGNEVHDLHVDLLTHDFTPEEEERRIAQAALVLEGKMAALEDLDSNSAQFMGTDEYFTQEVDLIRRRRRHVTEAQMHRFVEDFLRDFTPGARFSYEQAAQEGRLVPDGDLQRLIAGAPGNREMKRFYNAPNQGVPVTVSPDVAYRNPRIEFMNALHPLVRLMTDHCRENMGALERAHVVELRTGSLSPGIYFYFVCRYQVSGAKSENSLQMVLLDREGRKAADFDEAEEIMGEMVDSGRVCNAPLDHINADCRRQACDSAVRQMAELVEFRREATRQWHQAFVERRRESLQRHYERLIESKRQQLDREMAGERREFYLRMVRGRLKQLEVTLDAKTAELDAQADFSVSYEELAAGILRVTPAEG